MEHFKVESLFQFQPLGSALRFAEEIKDIVRDAPLFAGLNTQEINAMCSFMSCYAAGKGGVLVHEGEPGSALMVVLTGSVDVVKQLADGESVRMTTIWPGQVFGELSLIDSQCYVATCVANEPADFAVLTRAGLNEMLLRHPRLGNKLLLLLLNLFTERLRRAVRLTAPQMTAYAV